MHSCFLALKHRNTLKFKASKSQNTLKFLVSKPRALLLFILDWRPWLWQNQKQSYCLQWCPLDFAQIVTKQLTDNQNWKIFLISPIELIFFSFVNLLISWWGQFSFFLLLYPSQKSQKSNPLVCECPSSPFCLNEVLRPLFQVLSSTTWKLRVQL